MSTRSKELDLAPGCHTSVLYVRHPDSYTRFSPPPHESHHREPENDPGPQDHTSLAVGILGKIDARRKDYALLCAALGALPWQMREKLSI